MSKDRYLKSEDAHWQALKRGDSSAFEYIYRTHIQILYRYGMSLAADEDTVTDAIQDVFADIWHKRNRLGPTDSVKFYLLKSLKNRLFRMAAVASRFEVLEEKDGDYADICLREDVENNEDGQVFEQKLSVYLTEISARQREIVRLRFYENLSHRQIAEILQMSQQSAKNLLHRAIESLRKKITA